MSRPDPDLAGVAASLAAHVAAARRSGLRLAARRAAPAACAVARGTETLEQIRRDLGECDRCGLCTTRNAIVFGSGPARADLVFVGPAPTPADDARGLPFSGDEGGMLGNIITRVLGLSPGAVYLTHAVKCLPPGGRQPGAPETAACRPFLLRQLAAVGPALVCAFGEAAAQALLATAEPLAGLRGRVHPLEGAAVIATHDLSYLLRHQERKRETWEDMKLARRELAARARRV